MIHITMDIEGLRIEAHKDVLSIKLADNPWLQHALESDFVASRVSIIEKQKKPYNDSEIDSYAVRISGRSVIRRVPSYCSLLLKTKRHHPCT
jgi:hypothetical protein